MLDLIKVKLGLVI